MGVTGPGGLPDAQASVLSDAAAGTPERPVVVTIFGRVGAGADEVGPMVATALGLPYHPGAFSSATIAGDAAADADERVVLAKVVEVLGAAFGEPQDSDEPEIRRLRDELIAGNTALVRQYATAGGVIVGRNGATILAGESGVLHVLLTADLELRHVRTAEQFGLPSEQAAHRADREDEVRADMSQVLYGWDPRDPDHYDLVLDTGSLPVEAVVAAIVAAARVLNAA